MPVELPKDWPMPPPGWKPGDPVVIPPAPRAKEQQQMRLPPGLHRPPDVIQVRAVQLDILESDNSSDYSSDDASSDDEDVSSKFQLIQKAFAAFGYNVGYRVGLL
ncbi:hypothetical protein DY000_02000103 [Brassica cretica]|uniref:Uncharacterized protein n=1 Tax=Brassica cretica TaxID=69181 RepID=A0ABQ7CHA2_BRACR|nr:hypothetical protein DY000_02000103 [Brassica cretica]